jgi:hypothetical protein
MTDPQPEIIIVRTCPEHRCRIFVQERLWERGEAGEFRLYINRKRRKSVLVDHHGLECVFNDDIYLLDDRFPSSDGRHIVLRAHCFRTESLEIGGSGKIDPKEIVIGTNNYRQLDPDNPACALCEGGDMIPPSERFMGSSYRPDPPSGEFS